MSGATLPIEKRMAVLCRFMKIIRELEPEINAALHADLGKSSLESYMTEVGLTCSELGYLLKQAPRFAKPHRVRTPLAQFAAKSFELASPYGTVLVMSPWNYPFLLTMVPLLAALAAGNTVVVKPSAYAPATSAVIERLIEAVCPSELCAVVTGGREVNADLLEQCYDYIFFTGSKTVGQLVMAKAAEHLTPLTLELGGKSPCIVDRTANLELTARRLVFGKFLNLGQTCVAPDYLLVQAEIKQPLIRAIKAEIEGQLGADPLANPDYGRIINRKHYDRLCRILEQDEHWGGELEPEQLRIAPALVETADLRSASMQEEIFGPILPILTWNDWETAKAIILENPTPLALYLFTNDLELEGRVLREVSFGGGCINDTIIHLAGSYLGFGGVGSSGMGSYHGKYSLETFSHKKSIVDKSTWIDLPMRYQPYTERKARLIRRFLK